MNLMISVAIMAIVDLIGLNANLPRQKVSPCH